MGLPHDPRGTGRPGSQGRGVDRMGDPQDQRHRPCAAADRADLVAVPASRRSWHATSSASACSTAPRFTSWACSSTRPGASGMGGAAAFGPPPADQRFDRGHEPDTRLSVGRQAVRVRTWLAAITAVTGRCRADPARLRELGLDGFTAEVRRELPRFGGQRPARRIVVAVFEARLPRPARPGRGGDSHPARRPGVGASMASIPGMTAVTAAAILAEAGDPAGSPPPAPSQACRGRPGQQRVGPLHRGVAYFQAWPAPLRLAVWAGDLGDASAQSGAGRQVRPPHDPPDRQAHHRAGPRGLRGGGAPLDLRAHRAPHRLGPADRIRCHPARPGHHRHGRVTPRPVSTRPRTALSACANTIRPPNTGGASPHSRRGTTSSITQGSSTRSTGLLQARWQAVGTPSPLATS